MLPLQTKEKLLAVVSVITTTSPLVKPLVGVVKERKTCVVSNKRVFLLNELSVK